ncbi:hypothetical protein ACOME3_003439 [Neoechinorhynchus agilis]
MKRISKHVGVQFHRFIASNKLNAIFDSKLKAYQRIASFYPSCQDVVKSCVGTRMAESILDIKKQKFNQIVEFFCDKGSYVTQLEARRNEDAELGIDDFVGAYEVQGRVSIDENSLDLSGLNPDLVCSNLTSHWINDLPGFFKRVYDCLPTGEEGGAFLLSMFTEDSLFELRLSLQLAEMSLIGSISSHIPPQLSPVSLIGLLESSGFVLITVDMDSIVMMYPDLKSIFRDLKQRAETNCSLERPLSLRRDVIKEAERIYKQKFQVEVDGNLGLPLTYRVAYVVCSLLNVCV